MNILKNSRNCCSLEVAKKNSNEKNSNFFYSAYDSGVFIQKNLLCFCIDKKKGTYECLMFEKSELHLHYIKDVREKNKPLQKKSLNRYYLIICIYSYYVYHGEYAKKFIVFISYGLFQYKMLCFNPIGFTRFYHYSIFVSFIGHTFILRTKHMSFYSVHSIFLHFRRSQSEGFWYGKAISSIYYSQRNELSQEKFIIHEASK